MSEGTLLSEARLAEILEQRGVFPTRHDVLRGRFADLQQHIAHQAERIRGLEASSTAFARAAGQVEGKLAGQIIRMEAVVKAAQAWRRRRNQKTSGALFNAVMNFEKGGGGGC